ncbi:MAG: hypothetical protein E6G92_06460 [Alphaproteobacteria bacterium]|nr:MAG: hypothetical protein E6G92_06460 [Alphaproteobacteria bacterium]
MHGVIIRLFGTAAFGVAIFAASPAGAQALQDRFWLQASAYYPKIDTDVRLAPASNPDGGTEIDLEGDFGLDDREILPAINAGARIGGRFSIIADYYRLDRNTTATINRAITVENVTYPVNASVTAGFGSDVYRLSIGYAFLRRDNAELGASIGLHATDFSISLQGQGTVGTAPISNQVRRHDFLAPMPTIGLFGTWEIAPRLTLGGRIDWLSLGLGDYDGRLFNTQASLSYRFARNFGAGIMFRYVDYRVDVEKPNYNGRFTYSFAGPAAFIEVGF